MAVNPKAVASWGLLAEGGGAGGQVTQVIQEVEVRVAADPPLAVELEAAVITATLKDDH